MKKYVTKQQKNGYIIRKGEQNGGTLPGKCKNCFPFSVFDMSRQGTYRRFDAGNISSGVPVAGAV